MIPEAVRDDVQHITFALHLAEDAEQSRVQQLAALARDQARTHDYVDVAGFVFERDEDDAIRRSGPLAADDDAGHMHALTVRGRA